MGTRTGIVWAGLITLVALTASAQAATVRPSVWAAAEEAGPEGTVSVILHLTDRAPIDQLDRELKERSATRQERHATVVRELRDAAARSQGPVLEMLAEAQREGEVVGFTPYWISNLIVAQVSPAFLDRVIVRADIDVVELNFPFELIRPVAERRWYGDRRALEPGEIILGGRDIGVTPGLRAINADRCWYELGLTGAGTLICGFDTGVDGEHPALETRWRGYGGAHPDEECWFDCLNDSAGPPYDASSHGTHCMGTMTGVDGAMGDTVGVAWGATWIATNPIGQAGWNEEFDNDIIACYQWATDPDGVPETIDDVPDVCQNSWGVGPSWMDEAYYDRCTQIWWEVIDNCEAAGVVCAYSAGNDGPRAMSIGSPADRAEDDWTNYAVGAIDATNYSFPYPMADFSSRGPTYCDEESGKPEVSAPGVDVVSSIPGGGYGPNSGTSMACPHVAGTVALLREIDPDLEVDRIKQILMDTAVDHGESGEDWDYGWGVIDAYAACLAAMHGYGSVSGDVSDDALRAPVAGARVSVAELSRVAYTDETGAYDLKHLPAGTYDVVTECFGFDPDTSVVIVEDQGEHYLAITLVLQPRGTLLGTVTSNRRDAIEGVVIDILDAPVEKAVTDAGGNYIFIDLPARTYSMGAGLFGWIPQVTEVEVFAGDTTDLSLSFAEGAWDNFELDQGWIIGAPADSAYDGIWERDDPNATLMQEEVVQPEDDHTDNGVNCYLTHNTPPGTPPYLGDVDGGQTTLLSPIFDASTTSNPVLVYHRWFHTTAGYPGTGGFYVDVSDDGGASWVNVETLTEESGGWVRQEIPLLFHGITPTEQMQVRFVAEDNAALAAMIEAAVDDIQMTGYLAGADDVDGPLVLSLAAPHPNPLGEGSIVKFTLPRAQTVDASVYDTAGRLVRRLHSGELDAGVHRFFWDGRTEAGNRASSGVYFVKLATEGRDLSRKVVVTR